MEWLSWGLKNRENNNVDGHIQNKTKTKIITKYQQKLSLNNGI